MRTKLDSNLEGSRIYGQSYDPVYDPAYVRRQQRDEGFYNLEGSAQIRQTVLNLNAIYIPKKDWSVRPSIRFENLRQDAVSDFIETNIGAGPAFSAVIDEVEGDNNKKWNEFSEGVEVRYTGKPDWTIRGKGEWVQGSGNLDEKLILETGAAAIDRDVDYDRTSQKYSFSANWWVRRQSEHLIYTVKYRYVTNRDETWAGLNDFDAHVLYANVQYRF